MTGVGTGSGAGAPRGQANRSFGRQQGCTPGPPQQRRYRGFTGSLAEPVLSIKMHLQAGRQARRPSFPWIWPGSLPQVAKKPRGSEAVLIPLCLAASRVEKPPTDGGNTNAGWESACRRPLKRPRKLPTGSDQTPPDRSELFLGAQAPRSQDAVAVGRPFICIFVRMRAARRVADGGESRLGAWS
jgi:hypothetical protein